MPKIKAFVGNKGKNGKLTGTVRKIRGPEDLAKVQEGDILFSKMDTTPEYEEAMKKAKAIVTELGRKTGHACIVSRSMGKVCLFNARGANELLTDGQTITIDTSGPAILGWIETE